jgi:YNFM family putative membrane transporter
VTTIEEPSTAAQGHVPATAAYRRVVAALFAAGLATFTLLYSTQAILPELSARFGVSTEASTMTVSLTTLGLGAALLFAGPVSDRRGRTGLIHFSLAASSLIAIACAFSPNWTTLLMLRLFEGVALAGLPAVATAYLREELHPSAQARAAGLYIGGTALGGMTGRLLTGGVAEIAGWRWALGAAAVLSLACAVAVRILLPASERFVPAPSAAGTFVRALTDPALISLYLIGGCSAGALVAVFNTLGFRLADTPFHLDLAAASLLFLVYPVGTLSSALFGRMADRFGRRAVMPVGCVLAVGGTLLTIPAALPAVILGLALLVGGFFAVHGVASGWVPARAFAGGASTAQAASLYLFTYYLGSSVFGSLAGSAWADAAWPGVVGLAAILLCIAGTLALKLRRTPTLQSS